MAIVRETRKSKRCIWRWQNRFMHVAGGKLMRDKGHSPGSAPLSKKRSALGLGEDCT